MDPALPFDQSLREQFITEIDENFSVGCPAGSGKTRAITDRIARIAARPDSTKLLPCLVVVTFTQKAAEEMQERARAQVLANKPSPAVLMAFNRAFFGTIHSFAVTLLRNFGHYIGVASMFRVIETDELIWREFLQEHSGRPEGMDAETFDQLTRIYPFGDLLDLVRDYAFTRQAPAAARRMPVVDLGEVLAHPLPKRANQAANIQSHQAALREWNVLLTTGSEFNPLPSPDTGGKEFLEKADRALAPMRRWLGIAVAEAVHELAREFRAFRIRKGTLSFNDQVALAASLFRNGRAAKEIRARGYRVILDEAQDTDPHQFALLIELTRPTSAGKTSFLDTLSDGPRPGHFCMVGDPQQSIYGERADLGYYLAVHRALLASGSAKELGFAVTFRCDRAIVEFCNRTCGEVLNGSAGQVPYVTLQPRPRAAAGQVVRVPIGQPAEPLNGGRGLALESARQLARWLKRTGLERLRASSWSEVALLCPRKDWFGALRQALAENGLRCQFQSTREIKGDSPAFAWMTALVVCFAEPRNATELFGVLRELFGISDHDIGVFVDRRADRLSIMEAPKGTGRVADTLTELAACRGLFAHLPLRGALGEACSRLNLHGRLLALPAEVYPNLTEELDNLLVTASAAEAAGKTLEEFAGDLRDAFKEAVPTPAQNENALPIITNLKAKGLQWDCVVLPFFGREISFRALPYPRFLSAGCPVPLAFAAAEIPEDWKTRLNTARFHELERVLYVSLTRPKKSLVLVDDVELWGGADGQTAANSLARSLRVDAETRGPWAALPTEATADPAEPQAKVTHRTEMEPVTVSFPSEIPAAAQQFPRRVLPHALAITHRRGKKIEDPEQSATVSPDQLAAELEESASLRYGSWWHALMQALPWTGEPADRDIIVGQMLAHCPDPARGTREWGIFTNSVLGRRLLAGDIDVRVELPFMAPLKGGDSVDGIIDLAAFERGRARWLVVDWKSNRGLSGAALAEQYRPQLKAYGVSLEALTQMPVETWIYPTETGIAVAV